MRLAKVLPVVGGIALVSSGFCAAHKVNSAQVIYQAIANNGTNVNGRGSARKMGIASLPTNSQEIVIQLKEEGLPVSAMASIFKVERKTVYSWASGSNIQASNETRIRSIDSLLSKDKSASYRNLYRYWNVRFGDQPTLGELLTADELDEEQIVSSLATLWPLAKKAEESDSSRTKQSSGRNPILEEMGEADIS